MGVAQTVPESEQWFDAMLLCPSVAYKNTLVITDGLAVSRKLAERMCSVVQIGRASCRERV